jgi:DNA-binding NarL/FixJ family response regulator
MIRVLIADDHVVVRAGLTQLFTLMGDVTLAGEATDGNEVLDMLKQADHYDLLMLDLTMPGISGVNLISNIRATHKSLPILVLSMHNELQVAKRVLHAGATGFITKGSNQETLIASIRKVASGGHFIDPMLAEQMMFERPVSGEEVPHDRLSDRELHILKHIADGKTVNEIAELLFISNKTVSTHKARLMEKMNFQSTAELVRYAAEHALVE